MKTCPNCGELVPEEAKICPECGADEETADALYAPNPDLPDEEEFDYDEYKKREFGKSPVPHGMSVFWWVIAILVLVAVIMMVLR